MDDIEFRKYKTRGAYHWDQIGRHPLKRNAFVIGRYKNVIKLLKNALDRENLEDIKILDVGCGDGVLTYLMAKEKAIVFGIDNQKMAIDFAEESMKARGINVDLKIGSAYELCWEDGYFDAVVSSEVIEHLKDPIKYLREIKRVVKAKGIVVISTPVRFTKEPLDKMHVVEWFPDEFKKVIESEFPNSQYFLSHPLFWFELINRSSYSRIAVNLLSFFRNPFEGFNTAWRYHALQYSVSIK